MWSPYGSARWQRGTRIGGAVVLVAVGASCTGSVSEPAGSVWSKEGDRADASAVDSADSTVVSRDCTKAQTGVTPLQRLSRRRYENSVRVLLGIDAVDVSQLAEDEKVGAFDGNVVAPVSDLLVEQYATLAENVTRSALGKLEALVPCDRKALGDSACAEQFITRFGLRAYRRPLSDDEHTAYSALYGTYAGPGFGNGLRVVVQTMLQSPHFLYHVELAPSPMVNATLPLDDYELASRLAFFLTETTPDDALLDAAASGGLADDERLMAEATRLLDGARAPATFESFHMQWLGLDALDSLTKDKSAFPTFNDDMRAAMRTETSRFLAHVFREDDASLSTLFSAPYSFPGGAVRDIYGLTGTATDGPDMLDPTQRAGLLTQPSFLATHAHTNQTSPVARGTVIIRNLLCEVLPDPPPDINATAPDPAPGSTTRARFTEHEHNAACSGCHVRIDGIGFGFEAFDAIGAYRSTESGQTIDASGSIVGTRDLDGHFDGVREFAEKLVQSREFSDCAATQWFRYALGRFDSADDACTLSAVQQNFAAGRHDIPALLRDIVRSPAFRSKRVLGEQP